MLLLETVVIAAALLVEAVVVVSLTVALELLLVVVLAVVVVELVVSDARALGAEMGLGLYRLVSGVRPVPRIISPLELYKLEAAREKGAIDTRAGNGSMQRAEKHAKA